MADTLERKIPYLFPGDLQLRLDDQNFVTAISGYPVGGGGGTVVESDFIWKPVINQEGTIGWERDTSATTPATADLVPHIYNNYWYVGTTNTNVLARGPQGDPGANGTNGTNGEDGYSPVVSIDDSVQGQHTITITDKTHQADPHEFIVYDGVEGDPGYAPIITTKTVTGQGHNNSGTEITITYGEAGAQTAVYTAWNGNDGAGATVTLTGGEGIEVSQAGTNYTISVSADYALESEIPTKVTDLTDSANYLTTTVASQTYLDKTTYGTDSATYVTSSSNTISGTKQYALTTAGWAEVSVPTIPDITANNGLSANGHTVGISNNDIIANNQYAWTTTGWSAISLSAYLPLSGGTVSGQLTVSGSDFGNNLHLKRDNYDGFIGLANNGAITIKNVISNSTSQIEFLTSANKTFDITIKDNNSTPQPVGKLYVMSAHSLADATTASANWANDGMLHIILES